MQATTAPVPPVPPAVRPTIVITGSDGVQQTLPVPMNGREVAALRTQRTELSNQLVSASSRRHDLSQELNSAPAGPSRTGLEQRIEVLDKRILQLESDIASTGRQLSSAPLDVIASAQDFGGNNDIPDNVVATAFVALVLFPLAIVFARNMWKRGSRASATTQPLAGDAGNRLERLEQGMDAIAIEIERVSEGQRFVTKLLSEAQPGRLPIPAAQSEAAPAQTSLGS